ncbi:MULTISPECIES: hypothetical protein [Bradyrhizobium]|uniref:Blr7500 protein n=1 Tax=Bradyrhizobium diazoefficiens (strain JCM 10833 / BCRC 13528 / IAM 13628 / NBRC 14792 / USDA 110) TaxID=224911 RepID=Q89DD9_BRADU|nr:hypothetical protein [Bradyrhizobium diazoefficiens]MBP1062108.1 hypothetical protein [Bradyrhizobium japonicum]AND92449.1 hypothetical protein AAV28_35190 [Bradyrhizobium diazoefficiens USDA 110]AWO94303.1 hypothetical protein DI395_41325 [Bradyrhizobium diazoefficiens]PDT57719.1 hypothetical protein CO678_32020 [Bradyrhizobium diazoefficiens]QBP26243.1 hypothetical protein Bdiaspc4_39575 [Bradyrhizobium diazoefficiens]
MSPETLKFITDISPFGTALATVIGAVWVALTYFRSEKDAAVTRKFESRKPFLELQLKLYTETAQIAGKLAVADINKADYSDAVYRFWELYWSELAVVEDRQVERAMEQVGDALAKFQNGEPRKVVEDAVLDLAHALRDEIVSEWGAHIGTRIKKIATSA